MYYSTNFIFFKLKNLILLVLLLSPIQVLAKKDITIAVGLSKPPYVIQSSNSGFELDLITNVFALMNKSVSFIYTEFGHSAKMLNVDEIDAVMTTNNKVFTDESLLSQEYITYQNVAITRKEDRIKIDAISALSKYSIASFQKADKVLGTQFQHSVAESPLYLKIADQSQQPNLLIKKRVEVLIMDKYIFEFYIRQLENIKIDDTFEFHNIFPKTNYHLAFKNKALIRHFNEKLTLFKSSDAYSILKQKYMFE